MQNHDFQFNFFLIFTTDYVIKNNILFVFFNNAARSNKSVQYI